MENFSPSGIMANNLCDLKVQDLRNNWREVVETPINKTSLDRWLLDWSNLYDEAKAAKVPDMCYIPMRSIHPTQWLSETFFKRFNCRIPT